jgi:hypothetical protein
MKWICLIVAALTGTGVSSPTGPVSFQAIEVADKASCVRLAKDARRLGLRSFCTPVRK